jgi:hypothetical protein
MSAEIRDLLISTAVFGFLGYGIGRFALQQTHAARLAASLFLLGIGILWTTLFGNHAPWILAGLMGTALTLWPSDQARRWSIAVFGICVFFMFAGGFVIGMKIHQWDTSLDDRKAAPAAGLG